MSSTRHIQIIPYSYILLAILFLGLVLRIYDLGTESIWVDEGISIRIANEPLEASLNIL
jgi:predicted membrane-bound mannosyltransferase